ncbi:MAG: carboxypeptidase M32 [Candidatus Obscuribacter sp.]|nr:carboxypeptidase M32 [Candidatus Obscuribacter sp.]
MTTSTASINPRMRTTAYEALLKRLNKIADLQSVQNLLQWDQDICLPDGASQARSIQIGTIAEMQHELSSSNTTRLLIEAAEAELQAEGFDNDSDEVAMINAARRDYQSKVCLPTELVSRFGTLVAEAQEVWQQARESSNFALFQPYLTELVELSRQKGRYLGFAEHPYDALLDEYEPGMTADELRSIFAPLKQRLLDLRGTFSTGAKIDDSFLRLNYSTEKQFEFCKRLLESMGVANDYSRFDSHTSAFTTSIANCFDVRLTGRIVPDYLNMAIFSTIHEGGHALFDRGINPAYARTPLAEIHSMGLHESQSRLWENLIGRSLQFWTYHYPILQATFPDQLGKVTLEDFYRAINKVQNSQIRLEADEISYSLHIILRFELELALIEGSLTVADLPAAWNQGFEELFGTRPENDSKGVLQDIHWAGGAFGYFPTYVLGNLISAQLLQQIKLDIPTLEQNISEGDFQPLRQWLSENVHRFGRKYQTKDLVMRITKSPIDADAFCTYLDEKFSRIYQVH